VLLFHIIASDNTIGARCTRLESSRIRVSPQGKRSIFLERNQRTRFHPIDTASVTIDLLSARPCLAAYQASACTSSVREFAYTVCRPQPEPGCGLYLVFLRHFCGRLSRSGTPRATTTCREPLLLRFPTYTSSVSRAAFHSVSEIRTVLEVTRLIRG